MIDFNDLIWLIFMIGVAVCMCAFWITVCANSAITHYFKERAKFERQKERDSGMA